MKIGDVSNCGEYQRRVAEQTSLLRQADMFYTGTRRAVKQIGKTGPETCQFRAVVRPLLPNAWKNDENRKSGWRIEAFAGDKIDADVPSKAISNTKTKRKGETKIMSSNGNSSNKLVVPSAREAMNKFKMEAANEVGVTLKQGYNGDLTSKQAGSVGGQMVKKMTSIRIMNFERACRTSVGHQIEITYRAQIIT